ncbi:MAG: proline dehydrogenase family protein [Ignavibacteriaceae bacterium]|nr:proline dehydrogenase family protein [Ignavibacteriaceae bacterium]
MSISRNILLWCSQNEWLKKNVPQWSFVKKAVRRFMPGEELEDAICEAKKLKEIGIKTVFTYLGENVTELKEAEIVTQNYLTALAEINKNNLATEISLKLTQLGFDISFDAAYEHFKVIAEKAKQFNNIVWIDMEQSSYVDRTIEFYCQIKNNYSNVGLCLQAYLFRTDSDLKRLLEYSPLIRLVKGAYREPATIAFTKKTDVDENFFSLSKKMIDAYSTHNLSPAFATHDSNLISRIELYAKQKNLQRNSLMFKMLYGIKVNEQLRLAKEGYNFYVLISYGKAWYPWYVRRLAERPANIWFVIKNIFNK